MLAMLVFGCVLIGIAVCVPLVCVYYDVRPAIWNITLTIVLLILGAAVVMWALSSA